MSNQAITNPTTYSGVASKLEVTDKVHADVVNPILNRLINNDAYLKEKSDIHTATLLEKATKGLIMGSDFDLSSDAKKLKLINLADEVLAALAGTAAITAAVATNGVTTEKVAAGAITYPKLSFTPVPGKATANLFNKLTAIATASVREVDGTEAVPTSLSDVSGFIKVDPSTTYIRNTGYACCFYTIDKAFISSVSVGNTVVGGTTVTTPATAAYLRYNLSPGNFETAMIVKGTTLPGRYLPCSQVDAVVDNPSLSDDAILKNRPTLLKFIAPYAAQTAVYTTIQRGVFAAAFTTAFDLDYDSLVLSGIVMSAPGGFLQITLGYVKSGVYTAFANKLLLDNFELGKTGHMKITDPKINGELTMDWDAYLLFYNSTLTYGDVTSTNPLIINPQVVKRALMPYVTEIYQTIFSKGAIDVNKSRADFIHLSRIRALEFEITYAPGVASLGSVYLTKLGRRDTTLPWDYATNRLVCEFSAVVGGVVTKLAEATVAPSSYIDSAGTEVEVTPISGANGYSVTGKIEMPLSVFMAFATLGSTYVLPGDIKSGLRIAPGYIKEKYTVNPVVNVTNLVTDVVSASPKMVNSNLDAEVNMFTAYGQSWAVGFENVALTTAQQYDSLMFNGGIRSQCVSDDPAVALTSFVPAVERTDTGTPGLPNWGNVGETPCSGQADMVKYLMTNEDKATVDNVKYQLLLTSPGEGSKSLAELSKDSVYYNRFIAQIQAGYTISQALEKTFKVQAFSWTQDGSGNSNPYASFLEQLRLDIDAAAKAITGQTNDVKLITWQKFSYGEDPAADNRYIDASEVYPNIVCACPSYFLDTVSPVSLHFTAECQRWLGAYYGVAYKRTVIDGKKFAPLKPIKITAQGKIMHVKFNVPQPPLVFDTTWVAAVENKGFNLYTSAGVEKVIKSVTIVNADTIKIVAYDNIVATDVLKYGNKGTSWGRITGKRGNLRDSQGDFLRLDPLTLNKPMHNWCVLFGHSANYVAPV